MEYKQWLKKRGFKNRHEYQTYLAKRKGFKSHYEYADHLKAKKIICEYAKEVEDKESLFTDPKLVKKLIGIECK